MGVGAVPPAHWKRLAAHVIDLFVSFVLMGLWAALVDGMSELGVAQLGDGFLFWISLSLPIGLRTLMEGSSLQASVGKLAMGLRVVDERTGEGLSYFRAFVRAAVRMLVSPVVLVHLTVLLSDRRQGLWDMIAKTRVLNR